MAAKPPRASPGRKVTLLVAKRIDVTDDKHPDFGKDLKKLIRDFNPKLKQALKNAKAPVAPLSMGKTIDPILPGDSVAIQEYDGKKIPKQPEGTEVVIYYGHADSDTASILPAGGDLTERVSPDRFSSQLTQAGGTEVKTIFVLGCNSKDNGFADGLQRLRPNAQVYGSDGNVATTYEPTAPNGVSPTLDSTLDVGMELYDARSP